MAVPSIARIETGVVNPRHDSITTIIQVIQKAGLGVTYEWDGSFTIVAKKDLFEVPSEN
jgi:predicted transcriptional regulator